MIEKFQDIKGFLSEHEGSALFEYCEKFCIGGVAVEIGSYCGKSACYLGYACKKNNSKLFSIDHHHGSEEQQYGEEYFDEDIYDFDEKRVNTLPLFLENISKFNLTAHIEPIIDTSENASKLLQSDIDFVFIDGSHTFESARNDFACWSPKIREGGILAIHDIYDTEMEGGQAPREIYLKALDEGYELLKRVASLVILQKLK